MTHRIALALVAMVVAAAGCGHDVTPHEEPIVNESATETLWLAGAAETVITHVKDRPEVYMDLYARALVLSSGEQQVAIVAMDLGTVNYALSGELIGAIHAATAIPQENILICPSQTHNAPGVDDRAMARESQQWLAGTLAELVKTAAGNAQPATLRVGRAPVQIGYNRRLMVDGQIVMEPNPDGAVVPWVDTLAARDADGELISVLFSHAAHPVIVHWSSDSIGPDFPGYAVNHLRNLLGDSGVFMFAQGSCGNINGYPLRGGFAACDAAGLALAVAVAEAVKDDQPVAAGELRSADLTVSLPRPATGQGDLPFPMRAVTLGDELCVLTLTGEMFAEYQLWVEDASPFAHTFVFNHTNGLSAYIATQADYELGDAGGYECQANLDPSVEQIVRDGMLDLLNELKSSRD